MYWAVGQAMDMQKLRMLTVQARSFPESFGTSLTKLLSNYAASIEAFGLVIENPFDFQDELNEDNLGKYTSYSNVDES